MEKNISKRLQLSTAQVEAAIRGAQDLLTCDSREETLDSLRRLLQMKEKAITILIDHLERYVVNLKNQGISGASVAVVGSGYKQAISTAASQMVVFAEEMARLTHDQDISFAYNRISDRVDRQVNNILDPFVEQQETLLQDEDEAMHQECWATYHYYQFK